MLTSAALLLGLFHNITAQKSVTPDDSIYDDIVIGSGPGGGTVASALARANRSVLILEAGSDQSENPHSEIPALFPLAYVDPSMR